MGTEVGGGGGFVWGRRSPNSTKASRVWMDRPAPASPPAIRDLHKWHKWCMPLSTSRSMEPRAVTKSLHNPFPSPHCHRCPGTPSVLFSSSAMLPFLPPLSNQTPISTHQERTWEGGRSSAGRRESSQTSWRFSAPWQVRRPQRLPGAEELPPPSAPRRR